jgi:hypothetical protein
MHISFSDVIKWGRPCGTEFSKCIDKIDHNFLNKYSVFNCHRIINISMCHKKHTYQYTLTAICNRGRFSLQSLTHRPTYRSIDLPALTAGPLGICNNSLNVIPPLTNDSTTPIDQHWCPSWSVLHSRPSYDAACTQPTLRPTSVNFLIPKVKSHNIYYTQVNSKFYITFGNFQSRIGVKSAIIIVL